MGVDTEPLNKHRAREGKREQERTDRNEPSALKPPRIYSLPELRGIPFGEPPPLIERMIRWGETVLVVGRPKTGKSRLILQIALACSRGAPFLGRKVLRKLRVLLIDLENRPIIAQSRFRMMSEPHQDDANILIIAPETLAEISIGLDDAGMANLDAIIYQQRPDLLIIDTWRLFVGAGDENKSEDVVKGLKTLSSLKRFSPGLAIVLVHHLRKQFGGGAPATLRADPYTWVESVSGHHALVGHVDSCFGLEREAVGENGDELIVFGGIARNTESTTMLLEEDPDTLLFRPAEGAQALTAVLTPMEQKHWQTAKKLGGFTFGDLVAKTGTTNKKALSSMLKKAEAQNVIEHQGSRYVVRP